MGLSPEGIKPRFLSKPLEFDGVKIVFANRFVNITYRFRPYFLRVNFC